MPSGGQTTATGNSATKGAHGGGAVLGANADTMKEAEREDLGEREYNVEDFYWETGIAQAIAKNEYFGHLTLGVISFNAVWIGVDSDHNTAATIDQADLIFQVMEQVFCVFFSFEWGVRFMSFKRKRDGMKDGWFKFDSVLVGLMVMETWLIPVILGGGGGGSGMGDASMLRLLRLLRLTRMARLMRSVPELLVLLKGMVAAARSVFSTLVLLILFTYVFAIIFKQQAGEIEGLHEYFRTIPEAMWNLLLAGTLLDNITDRLNLMRETAPFMAGVFMFWVLISSFTILNMLIGVLCEVVAATAEAEKEKNIVSFVKGKLIGVLERMDEDHSGAICETEFESFVEDQEAKEPLDELGVDIENLKALKDVIFAKKEVPRSPNPAAATLGEDDELPIDGAASYASRRSQRNSILAQPIEQPPDRELTFAEILEMILDLRSENPAMVKDIVDLRKHLRNNHKEVEDMFRDLAEEQAGVARSSEDLQDLVANIGRRQEEMITNMIAPLAKGVQDIQETLATLPKADKSCSKKHKNDNKENGESPSAHEASGPGGGVSNAANAAENSEKSPKKEKRKKNPATKANKAGKGITDLGNDTQSETESV